MDEINEDDHINEDFLSWMMLDIETKNNLNLINSNNNLNNNNSILINDDLIDNYNDSNVELSSPENNDNSNNSHDNNNHNNNSNNNTNNNNNNSNGNNGNNSNNDRITGQKRKVSRSRELAKESRNRQRLRMQETEKRIAELRSENSELQAHLQNVTQRTTEVQRQRLDMERIMAEKIRDMNDLTSANSRELEEILTKFVDLYADYGSYRQKEVAFHLGQLEKLFLPTQTTKMLIWLLLQDQKFYEIDRSPLFKAISTELELTPEQTEKIKQKREIAKMFLDLLQECVTLIRSLKVAIEKKHALFDRACGSIMKEATPTQNIKFLLWITRNAEHLSKVIPDFKRSVPHLPQAPILNTL